MKTQVFAYRGILGAITDMEKGIFLNDPKTSGQLGVVIPTSEVEITGEAKELIRKARREGGSFAPIMLTRHGGNVAKEHKSSLGLMGGGYHLFMGEDLAIGRDCELSVLDDCTETEIKLPKDFIAACDDLLEPAKK